MDGKGFTPSASELSESIQQVRRAFTRENLDGLEAIAAQTLVLLVAEPGLSVKECADRLSAGQSNVSTALKRLEQDGLVERSPSKPDPRIHSLAPTAEGERRVRAFLAAASSEGR